MQIGTFIGTPSLSAAAGPGVTAPNLSTPVTQYGAQGETITDITIGNSGSAATFAIAGDSPTSGAALTALGLSLNTSNGTISGTLDVAATVDTHTIKVEATNAGGTDSVTFDLVVTAGTTVTLSTTSYTWEQDDGDTLLMSDVGLASATGVVASATLTLADTGAAAGWDDGDDEILAVGYRIFETGTDKTSTAWARGYKFTLAYTASTGVLSITPTDTTDVPTIVMQTLLRTTKFWRLGAGLTPGARTLDVKINDGSGDSNEPTITITQQVKLTIKVVDYLHSPISGASVTLKDSLASTVDSGTSDVNGEVVLQFTENGADYDIEVIATGKQSYTVTRSIGGNQHICIPMFTNKTTIDASWLADTANLQDSGDSNSPYRLQTADTLYQLSTAMTRPNVGLVLQASGIGFDLAGNTFTYANESAIGLTNEGFETGTSTGWDFTGAPSASVVANNDTGATPPYLFGSYCCKFTSLNGAETIVSDPMAIPEADRPYAAACWTMGLDTAGESQLIEVYDDVTETLLASESQSGGQKSPHVVFTPTTTNNIRVEVTITTAAAKDVWLDDIRVRYHGVVGILAGYTNSGLTTNPGNTWTGPKSTTGLTTAYIMDSSGTGSITQGSSNPIESEAIYTQGSTVARVVDNVSMSYNSDHAEGLQCWYHDGETYITSCTITGGGYDQHLWNRAEHIACIKFGGGQDTLTFYVEGNTFVDVMHQAVAVLDPKSSGYDRFIRENTISGKTKWTNSYALLVNGMDYIDLSYNTIATNAGGSGRGILFDSSGRGVRYATVKFNDISIRERPNAEYNYDGLEAAAFRIRSYNNQLSSWHGYSDFQFNRFYAYTDTDHVTEAAGLKSNFVSENPDIDVNISDNIFRAIVNTTNTSYVAYAMNVGDSDDNTTNPIILRRNMADSNDIGVKFLGGDAGQPCHDVFFYDTEIAISSSGASRTYKTIYADGSPTTIRVWDTYFLDTVVAGGADTSDITFTGANNPKWINVGWTADVLVNGGGGATVTADDNTATEVFSGTADGSGMVEDIVLIQTEYRQATSNPAVITETDYNNHDFTCIKAGETNGTAEVTADRPRYFEMDFNTAYTPPSLNDPGTQNNDLGDTGVSLTLTNSGSAYDYTEVSTGPLPDDLTLSGLTVSGNINAGETPGTFPVVISAVNAYGSGSSSFDWVISSGITVPTYTVETASTVSNASSLTINTPAGGSLGQRMYAMVISAPRAMATPTGWILEGSQAHSIGGYFLYIYSRDGDHAGGSEPASHTFSTTGLTGSIAGAIFTIDGDADPAVTAPAIVIQEEAYGGPWHSPAVTVPANSSLSICFGGVNSNTLTDLTQNSHTAIAQESSHGAANLALMWREDSAGARAELSWTQTSANYRLEGIISIPPA